MGTSGTDTIPTSPNIFDLAVNRYGSDYSVFDDDNGNRVYVDVSDDTNIENDDKQNSGKEPSVAQTNNRVGEIILILSNYKKVKECLYEDLKTFPSQ